MLLYFQDMSNNVASHILMFMAIGVTSSIKSSIGYFPTRNATACDLIYWLWESVDYLETTCGLKVCQIIICRN